jgi:hypothetical protein
MAANGIYPIADVIYNHRDGGEWEDNPAVRDYIMNYPWGGCSGGATPYPVNGKMRYRLPLGGGSGNGEGNYYFKFASASGNVGFHGKQYKLYFRTHNTVHDPNPIYETPNNGGSDCGQDSDQIWLGRDIFAAQEIGDCNTDEFYLQLEEDDFISGGDFLEMYIEEVGGGGTGIDQRIYGVWSPNGEIIDQLAIQTRTDFNSMPSGQGAMHWRHFKPNGITHTCLTGDLDYPYFFFDVEQEYNGSPEGQSTRQVYNNWTRWLWNTVGIRGYRMDAVKHFPASFVGELLNDLHSEGINPPMVVGEHFTSDAIVLKNWVDAVYSSMTPAAASAIKVRAFDFELRQALKNACDDGLYDVRNILNLGMVDRAGMSGFNVVTFVNNHDYRTVGEHILNRQMLAYAYILTNNRIGLPSIFYPDYYGIDIYGPSNPLDEQKEAIDELMQIHKTYLTGATFVDYLNRFLTPYGSGYQQSGPYDHLLYQIQGGIVGKDVIVVINFENQALKFNHTINTANAPLGTPFNLVAGQAGYKNPVVENNPYNNLLNSLYFDIPAYSYAVFVQGCPILTEGGEIAATQTICSGNTPAAFTSISIPSGHSNTLEYQWQMTTVGENASFNDWVNIGSNASTYTHTAALTSTTWFRRLARLTCDPVDWEDAVSSNLVKVDIFTSSPEDYYRSQASGNWDDSDTWESSTDNVSWCAATLAPTSDAASVNINHQVSLTQNATVGDITISDDNTLILQNHQLQVTGNWINNGTLAAGTSTVTFSGSGANTLGGTSTNTFYNLVISKESVGEVTASGNLEVIHQLTVEDGTFNSASSYHDVLIESSGSLLLTEDITVSGNWTNNGTFTHGGYTVTFTGFDKTIAGNNATAFSTLTLANGSKITGTVAPTASVFNIQDDATYVHAHNNTIVPGTTKNFATSSTYEWQGSTSGFPSVADISFGNVIINSGSGNNNASGRLTTVLGDLTILNTGTGSYRLAGSTNPVVTISGNLVVEDGELNFSSTTGVPVVTVNGDVILNGGILKPQLNTGIPVFYIQGNWVNNGGDFSPGSGTVELIGTATQTLSGSTENVFYGLTINNAAGVQMNNNQSVSNQLTLTDGIIATNTSTLTILESGNITGGSAGSHVSGKLARVYDNIGLKEFPVGKNDNYYPMSLEFTSLSGISTVNAETFATGFLGTAPPGTIQVGTRYWNVNQTGGSDFSYNITLDGTGLTFVGTPQVLKFDTPNTIAYTADLPEYTATGLTSLSDFALGENTCQPPDITDHPSSDPQTLCQNAQADELSVTATGDGLNYQWYKNTASVASGGEPVGAITNTYTPETNEAGTLYYYVVITGDCGTATSTVSGAVTVDAATNGGTIGPATATVCSGTNSTVLTLSGHTGDVQKWESSTDGTSWTEISNTSATYTATDLAATTHFRAVVKSGVCDEVKSQPALITVKTLSVKPTAAFAVPVLINSAETSTLSFTGGSLGTGADAVWYTGSCGGDEVGRGSELLVSPTTTTTYWVRFEGDCNTTDCFSVTVWVSGEAMVFNTTDGTYYSLIQPAIDAAELEDIIRIMTGIYPENVNTYGKSLTLQPGFSQGEVTVTGTFTLSAGDVLEMELFDDDDYDKFIILDDAIITGASLDIKVVGSYKPEAGTKFTIFTSPNDPGKFSNPTLIKTNGHHFVLSCEKDGGSWNIVLTAVASLLRLQIKTID